jgi:Tfp pilus assembly protein PilE
MRALQRLAPLQRSAPRRFRRSDRRRGGFTLAELAVIVAVLALLGVAVVPNYIRYVYRARRTEAITALRAIHDAQSFHFAKENEYSASFEQLAFDLESGTRVDPTTYDGRFYTYTIDRWDVGGRANANYRATATGNIDTSDDTLDIVIIENALTVKD